jgi:hypothetical protein
MLHGSGLPIPFLITSAWRNFLVACYSEARSRADPDVGPRWGENQSLDTADHYGVAYGPPVPTTIAKAAARTLAPDAWAGIRHVAQPGSLCRCRGGSGQRKRRRRRLRFPTLLLSPVHVEAAVEHGGGVHTERSTI